MYLYYPAAGLSRETAVPGRSDIDYGLSLPHVAEPPQGSRKTQRMLPRGGCWISGVTIR
jgi:hypothetical protein